MIAEKTGGTDRVNVAIVGAGIGAFHLKQGCLPLQKSFAVSTICDLNNTRASKLAQSTGAKATTSYEDILADPKIDLVDICLPPCLHLEAVTQALDAGKHVVCEKPLALSIADVDKITATSTKSGKKVFPVFQYRFNPGLRRLASLCASGVCGKLHAASIETHWNRDAAYYRNDWRGKWATEGGGAVLGHAIHIHDMLNTYLGPVVSVQAMLETSVNDIEVEDCAAICFRLQNGGLATSSITLGASADTSRFRACFENATVESGNSAQLDLDDWKFSARNDADPDTINASALLEEGCHTGYAGFFEEVRKSLAGKDNKAVSLEDARSSIELCSAIYLASRENRTIGLPIDEKNPVYDGWAPS